jgi:hypothetical protein
MGGCQPAFAGSQSLDREASVVTRATFLGIKITIDFNPGIAYGETADLDAWFVQAGIGSRDVTSVKVVGGSIELTLSLGSAPTRVDFTGPQPIFRTLSGAVLESFSTPIPF